ncbi:unnamed protein product [Vitrella brassicaformis CCMP3155]|uniref:Cytochrome oxidase subunit II copper A binding domain-containing protein n=2 Tax=Vitrella brassicaformis TaxID=1169539 RepID=A0A0G4EZK5_VITBC|nr:unnamed protein product [Vitrella brassicaformis CCMP3155]|mmetsp:Transcript_26437/g.65690  ORF Transcript_26437/g.65690 Transcript_26437/m.65690 type:complete len:247 (+) Transcript_26437:39-779(+)|eukprot:CEM04530.1 unnamed protein product [Vitrella brassicaformis CCMP3155]
MLSRLPTLSRCAAQRLLRPSSYRASGVGAVRLFGGAHDGPVRYDPMPRHMDEADPPNVRHIQPKPHGEQEIYQRGAHPNVHPDAQDQGYDVHHLPRSNLDYVDIDGAQGTNWWDNHYDSNHFDAMEPRPPPIHTIEINGQTYIKPAAEQEQLYSVEEMFYIPQDHVPLWARRRVHIWCNYPIMLRAEFCFFYVPTFIVFSLLLPAFCMLYMWDEAVYTTMTVKCIGRQWYWVYEVETPTDDQDEEE